MKAHGKMTKMLTFMQLLELLGLVLKMKITYVGTA